MSHPVAEGRPQPFADRILATASTPVRGVAAEWMRPEPASDRSRSTRIIRFCHSDRCMLIQNPRPVTSGGAGAEFRRRRMRPSLGADPRQIVSFGIDFQSYGLPFADEWVDRPIPGGYTRVHSSGACLQIQHRSMPELSVLCCRERAALVAFLAGTVAEPGFLIPSGGNMGITSGDATRRTGRGYTAPPIASEQPWMLRAVVRRSILKGIWLT
jgi:hypothetical protein